MKKRSKIGAVRVSTSKLTRARAEKISAVEGLVLSRSLAGVFKEFDSKGLTGQERRAILLARFQKKSA